MSDGIYVALSGAIGRARQLEVISSNLANMQSTAYRRVQPTFREMLAGTGSEPGGQAPAAVHPADRVVPADQSHVVVTSPGESRRPGILNDTGSPLDLAIEGEGFFTLQTPQGIRYTRDGHLARGTDGMLTSTDGSVVLGAEGPIKLGEGNLDVSSDGTVSSGGKKIDRLRIAMFPPGTSLTRVGFNRYKTGQEPQQSQATVHQGKLESSNVRPLSEMVDMIEVQRTFEALQEVIRAYRDLDNRAIENGRPI